MLKHVVVLAALIKEVRFYNETSNTEQLLHQDWTVANEVQSGWRYEGELEVLLVHQF